MHKTALYIEATSGVAGDMFLGALLDTGAPVELLYEAWNQLALDNYEIEIFETQKSGIRALQCRVRTKEDQGPRTWKQYERILKRSNLKESIRVAALSLCRRLFELEASIHGSSLEKMHLHEMGGTDLIVDVVGTLTAIDFLAPAQIHASPVNTGKGFVRFSHGRLPVPTPAAAKLLEGVPIFQDEREGELTTPTGALLLTHLTKTFGPMPPMHLQKTGVGAGEKDFRDHANVLRIFVGTLSSTSEEEDVCLIETNVDDSNPQVLAYFMERAFEQGALDVFFTPIFMKKNRPGTRVSVLASASIMDTIVHLLFSETTAIGLRYWKVGRKKMDRRWKDLRIGRYPVRMKESYIDGTLYNYQPEYEDCKKIAQKTKRPVKEVIAQTIHEYLKLSE
jgi:uncharacterized protein (TIGR00299 family) protein